jgi:hypothetical protein
VDDHFGAAFVEIVEELRLVEEVENGTRVWVFNREMSTVSRGMNSGTTKAAGVVSCGLGNRR